MKSFDDFRESLGEDAMRDITQEVIAATGDLDGESAEVKISVLNFNYTLALLRRYHEWLNS